MKFQIGDKVRTRRTKVYGKIISRNIITDAYLVKFDDLTLIPPIMTYNEEDIEHIEDNWCPKCKTELKVTRSPVLDKLWLDCLKCNKTIEQLKEENKPSTFQYDLIGYTM